MPRLAPRAGRSVGTLRPGLATHLRRAFEALRPFHELYRDFRDIAERLFEVVARNLPVEGIDYYARLDDGAILTLSHQTRYSGFTVEPPGAISAIPGLTRAQWLARHRDDPAMAAHRLHDDTFCTHPQDSSGLVVTLPLFSPNGDVMQAAALIQLGTAARIGPEETDVIEQIMMPLQVALEREVIYRSIEAERQKAYRRSIRDSLTALFTRLSRADGALYSAKQNGRNRVEV